MRFFENRFVWKDLPEAAPPEGGSAPPEDNDQEEPVTDGTKVAPEDSGEAVTQAQDQAAVAAEDDAKAAEAIADQADQLDAASGDSSGVGAGAGTGAAAGSAASVIPEDIIKEIQEKGPYKVAQEKLGVGPLVAGILTIFYYMYKDQLFNLDTSSADQRQQSLEQARVALQQQYQAHVDSLIAGGKLPAGIKVEETDPALTDQTYGIKKADDLDAYLTGKRVLTVPSGTSLIDYLDQLESVSATQAPAPVSDTGDTANPVASGDTGASGSTAVDTPVSASELEPAPEPAGPFKRCPKETVDFASGKIARFILPNGDTVILDRQRVMINGKKFKISVDKGIDIPLQFDRLTPLSNGGYNLTMSSSSDVPGVSEEDESAAVDMTSDRIVDFLTYLVAQRNNSEFERVEQRPDPDHPDKKEDVKFVFEAA
ncbi:hypothetical protein COW94_01220 [Candidatus Peregrinibacteria bacterium CG22_combo_CG10-13_8_21_14_all_44_10]|nr:MAG: hypothetical protein AUK45_04535 [Candidatus Peregrinibacteria bacterium CG2_30_44_17]PIP66531.1 MAG: hypothetical protein COW94_01220 [Candidatus Peregrinibacteria bacterium CG22_combo_CG10-13_8_21_14_all_44_10]